MGRVVKMNAADMFIKALCDERHEAIRHEFSLVQSHLKEIRVIMYTVAVGVMVGLVVQAWDKLQVGGKAVAALAGM